MILSSIRMLMKYSKVNCCLIPVSIITYLARSNETKTKLSTLGRITSAYKFWI